MASAWMFCASCSSTPQLIAGGRSPRPRKESDVSLMIMAGSASVVAAMMWQRNDGTMWRKMIRIRLQPGQLGGHDEVLLAQRQEPAAHDAGQLGPADQRDDDRDGEVDLDHRPVVRQRGGQPHPQRDGRDRAEDLDDALDDGVEDAAVVAGDAAEQHAQDQADRDAGQADDRATSACANISRDQRSRPCSSVPSRNSVSSGCAPSTPMRWRLVGIRPNRWYSNPRREEPHADLLRRDPACRRA